MLSAGSGLVLGVLVMGDRICVLLQAGCGLAVAVSAFLPWVRLGDQGLTGFDVVYGVFALVGGLSMFAGGGVLYRYGLGFSRALFCSVWLTVWLLSVLLSALGVLSILGAPALVEGLVTESTVVWGASLVGPGAWTCLGAGLAAFGAGCWSAFPVLGGRNRRWSGQDV